MRVLEDQELELVSGGSIWSGIGSAISDVVSPLLSDVTSDLGKAINDTKAQGSASVQENRNGFSASLHIAV